VPYNITHLRSEEHKLEPPLKGQGELTCGYGSTEWPPYVYQLSPGRDLDVGFLKIYLSTEAVDLSDIPQGSAFTETRRSAPVWHPQPLNLLGTIIIPIIQRRRQSLS
jgi:hypothetical protein